MSDWASGYDDIAVPSVSPWSELSFGSCMTGNSPASTSWWGANFAILVPFRIPVLATAQSMVYATGSGALTDEMTLAILRPDGTFVVGTGTFARGAATGKHIQALTAPTVLAPGWYYMGMSCAGTPTFRAITQTANVIRMAGVRGVNTGHPLTGDKTPSATTGVTIVPLFGVRLRTPSAP